MTRRHLLSGAAALAGWRRAAAAVPDCPILVDAAGVRAIRAALANGPAFAPAAEILRQNVESALTGGPWSVTTKRPTHVKTSPNDYYSEGPYWWPDPKNPQGPYIRKDGERYPGYFKANHDDLGRFGSAVLALGMGASLLGDRRCGPRAALVLSTWCTDPKTRMTPNLEFGQAVPGHNTGRGTGIIDTRPLIDAAQGIKLLAAENLLETSLLDGVLKWFTDYLHWMTTSGKGREEKSSGNNHATWWTAQAAAYASLVGDRAAQAMCWQHYKDYLVPTEIQVNGACPREEERTNSLSYSSMNLDAFSVICRVAETNGVKLWDYRTTRGIGPVRSYDYLLPYVLHPDRWKGQQISKFNPESVLFPGLAGVGMRNGNLLDGYRSLPRSHAAWIQLVDLAVRTA